MPKRKPSRQRSSSLQRGRLGLRRVAGDVFELVHPPCARARKEDLDEVRAMLGAQETEIAVDELRWLLSGCTAFLEGHQLLGEIALAQADFVLARGHFGTAFELGRTALGQGFSGRLPAERPANRPFFESGKGLAWSLKQAGELRMAEEVVQQLLRLDPDDPLRLGALLTARECP